MNRRLVVLGLLVVALAVGLFGFWKESAEAVGNCPGEDLEVAKGFCSDLDSPLCEEADSVCCVVKGSGNEYYCYRAAGPGDGDGGTAIPLPEPPAESSNVPTEFGGGSGVFTLFVNWAFGIAGSIAVIVIIYAGLQYLFAGTNTDLKDKAKNTLTYAVIGLIVVLLAFVIVNLIAGVFIP